MSDTAGSQIAKWRSLATVLSQQPRNVAGVQDLIWLKRRCYRSGASRPTKRSAVFEAPVFAADHLRNQGMLYAMTPASNSARDIAVIDGKTGDWPGCG